MDPNSVKIVRAPAKYIKTEELDMKAADVKSLPEAACNLFRKLF